MKYLFVLFFLLPCALSATCQTEDRVDTVIITYKKSKTRVSTTKSGELHLNVSPKDILKIKATGFVRYSDFGARGDGKRDDIDAIAAAHAFANQHGLLVKADEGATYYIGGKKRTAVIQTDTDFGTAAFIIDDTRVEDRNAPVFLVSSGLEPVQINGISSLKRNQERINISLSGTLLVTVTDSTVRRYIRFGRNQNNGSPQTDIFIVNENGNVDMGAPVIWDFDQITAAHGRESLLYATAFSFLAE